MQGSGEPSAPPPPPAERDAPESRAPSEPPGMEQRLPREDPVEKKDSDSEKQRSRVMNVSSEAEDSETSSSDSEHNTTHTQREVRAILPPASDFRSSTQAADTQLQGDFTEWRTFILDRSRTIPLPSLCWDYDAQFGQVRPVRSSVIKYYIQSLLSKGEPIKPVQVFVKMQPGVYSLPF